MPVAEASSIDLWMVALAPPVLLAIAWLALARRRAEVKRFEQSHRARQEALKSGSHKARLLHPDIDLTRCIGCGACVSACPEEGVLDLLHGQAVVVHGSRCVGHAKCAEACPTGAIALTFADLSERKDLPATKEDFEAVGVPGLYIAGELTGFSLVRNAVAHGSTVADAVSRAFEGVSTNKSGLDDLLIVGAGPAGIACALRAKELGLRFSVIDQAEAIGGTVATYPRRKMVMTQAVHLPLHGQLPRLEYLKEELIDLWTTLAKRHELPITMGVKLESLERAPDGTFTARTNKGELRAARVCLALGRRGAPRKLGVPGECLSKVCYSLLDAESYQGRKILVVGGGDSAIEAALGLAAQTGNFVTLSYRGKDFNRLKARNDSRVRAAIQAEQIEVLFESTVAEIKEESVRLRLAEGERTIPNDEIFIFAGGDPPFGILEKIGVSFDAADRPVATSSDRTATLLWAVGALLFASVGMGVWAILNDRYYSASHGQRAFMNSHTWLRPSAGVGLLLGISAVAFFAWNLTYLARRSRVLGRLLPGSLKFWMGSHVFTGLGSFLCVLVHAGFTYRLTVGGYAFVALGVVLVAGMVGRYFYALVPHAANGRELDLEELRTRLASLGTEWDRSTRGMGEAVRARIDALVDRDRWSASFLGRVRRIALSHFEAKRLLREVREDARRQEVPPAEIDELLALVRHAHKLTMQIAHYEEIRAVLSSWRFVHRWLSILMVLFVIAHVVTAARYAHLDWASIPRLFGGAH